MTKEELRKKIYNLESGDKPYADFHDSYVDELLDEMFPNNKSVEIGSEFVSIPDNETSFENQYILEIFE